MIRMVDNNILCRILRSVGSYNIQESVNDLTDACIGLGGPMIWL